MKMQSLSLVIGIVLLTTTMFAACKKGDTGPAGAQGPAGQAGSQGPAGSANVQYSKWDSLSMTYVAADTAYEQTITADSITQRILDSGIVLSYIKVFDSAHQVIIANANTFMEVFYSLKTIQLYAARDFSDFGFRYVIIPGGMVVGRSSSPNTFGYTKEEWEKMSYSDVMKKLGKH